MMTTNDDGEDNSEDNHQGEEDRAGDEDKDLPNAQMTQHHGERQEDDNNDKDLHHRTNEWLEDEHGTRTRHSLRPKRRISTRCLGPR
jgi:hypothetical protein